MTTDFRLYLLTWNVGEANPPKDLTKLLGLDGKTLPNLYAVGLQEMRSTTADLVFEDNWTAAITDCLSTKNYVRIKTRRQNGIHISVYGRKVDLSYITNVESECTKTGLGGLWGNKGALSVRLTAFGVNLCIVAAHYAAHSENFRQRIEDYNLTLETQRFRDKDCETILDHDYVFWMGDLNFRIDGISNEEVRKRIKENDLAYLSKYDQLSQAITEELIFIDFLEGPLNFAPTFKFDVGTDDYDTSAKNRVPSWCDRILWRVHEDSYEGVDLSVEQLSYTSITEEKTSDHRPVVGEFAIQVLKSPSELPVMFEPIGCWCQQKDNEVSYLVSSDLALHSRDWIGLYRDGYKNWLDYVTYVWASGKGDDMFDGSHMHSVLFEMRYLQRLPSDTYYLLYFSFAKNCVVGYSDGFRIVSTEESSSSETDEGENIHLRMDTHHGSSANNSRRRTKKSLNRYDLERRDTAEFRQQKTERKPEELVKMRQKERLEKERWKETQPENEKEELEKEPELRGELLLREELFLTEESLLSEELLLTQEPLFSEEPLLREQPLLREEPGLRVQPLLSEEPLLTQEPLFSEEPLLREQPLLSEELLLTQEPLFSEEPLLREQPLLREEPLKREQPFISEEPLLREQPLLSEEPLLREQPLLSEEPLLTQEPLFSEEPLLREQPLLREPLKREQPFISEEPLLREQPLLSEELLLREQPLLSEEPLLTQEPLFSEKLLLREQPLLSEEPLKREQPLISEEPLLREEHLLNEELLMREEPLLREESVLRKHPLLKEEPLLREQPLLGEEPLKREQPLISEEPLLRDEPLLSKEPLLREQPLVSEEPLLREQPLISEQPLLREVPLLSEEPLSCVQEQLLLSDQPAWLEIQSMCTEPVQLLSCNQLLLGEPKQPLLSCQGDQAMPLQLIKNELLLSELEQQLLKVHSVPEQCSQQPSLSNLEREMLMSPEHKPGIHSKLGATAAHNEQVQPALREESNKPVLSERIDERHDPLQSERNERVNKTEQHDQAHHEQLDNQHEQNCAQSELTTCSPAFDGADENRQHLVDTTVKCNVLQQDEKLPETSRK